MIKPILIIALKELRINISNYWILLIAVLLLIANYGIISFSSSFDGFVNQANLNAILMSFLHLQMYLIPLFAMIISFDGMLKERELGTLYLLLSYPLPSSAIVIGKWLGYSLTLALTIVVAFIPAFIKLSFLGVPFIHMLNILIFSIWLGVAFISIGLFLSILSKDRTLVIAINMVAWLFFVFLFDVIFVLLTVYTNGVVDETFLGWVILLNPIDVYRVIGVLLNFSSQTKAFYGVGYGALSLPFVLLSLLLWTGIPLFFSAKKNFTFIK